jgi:carbamoylphosphate synthase large subunit
MSNVVFVAPYFMDATLRFVAAAASLPGVRLGLVSQDPASKLQPALRAQLTAHEQVADALDPRQITAAVRALEPRLGGPVQRLLGTLEQLQVPLAHARRNLAIGGLDVESAHNFRDKARMKAVLERHDLPCARHRLAQTAEEVWAFRRDVGYPLVLKPPAGAGARDTYRIDNDDELERALAAVPPSRGAVLMEEFVVGDEYSFDSVFIGGRMVWHSISRYFPTPLEVLNTPWIQWVVLLPREIDGAEYEPIRRAGARAVQVLGMQTGLSHMEWFRRRDGSIAISEVGARPPGAQFTTLLSYAHDIDMYKAWAQLMIFDAFDPPPRHYAAGAAFLRGQGTGRVVAIHGLDAVRRAVAPVVVEAKLPRAGQSPSGTYEGDGYLIVRHPETRIVENALHQIVSTIRVELG